MIFTILKTKTIPMKKITSLLLLLSVFFYSKAQDDRENRAHESGIYIKAGVNLANVSVTKDGQIDDANQLVSFHGGIMADMAMGRIFSFQPGLFFTGKGSKIEIGSPSDPNYLKGKTNPYYVELPLNLILNLVLNGKENSKLFAGAGPYGAIGVSGKRKSEGKILGTPFKSEGKIKFSSDDPTTFDYEEGAGLGLLKRFDYGFNITGGYVVGSLMMSANYGYGLAKINSGTSSSSDDENKHRVLSFSIAVRL